MKHKLFFAFLILFFSFAFSAFAYQTSIVYFQGGDVKIENPEIAKQFYDELKGEPRNYFISSDKDFLLYVNLLVPEFANKKGRYSANIFFTDNGTEELVAFLDGENFAWQEIYDELQRDYFLKGPEFSQQVKPGNYRIEVFSNAQVADEPGNQGKYVLAVGKKETYDAKSVLNIFWHFPLLKIQFFQTNPLQFFLTPFGIALVAVIGAVMILLAIFYYFVGAISEAMKHKKAKTLLLTSAGMQMKEEIIKLLQKPAYDITVAFITTAAKPEADLDYVKNDWTIMKEELGFNVEEVDIEGKTQAQVMKLLQLKDIIFVEGGNTFYLLKAMRKCNFEKIIRKLLKLGKVYIGVSAGSIVAGRTIKTAGWKNGDKNTVGLVSLKGLNLVPFDIFVHFQPEHADLIMKKMRWKWQRRKLKILTDEQAILVQGKDVMLIGKGNKVVI
ncbi:MAG: Type 1 glutamine amidotransferase-like domain-containing protein [Candidatus Staskawiczbacteria bacterium]|nr:Type 1 glutamine amidotransferase-like domain-containing protein [Candidatus Staskawiczbacteria bacterium]